MTGASIDTDDPRIKEVVAQLQGMIQQRYPTATFSVASEDDSEGIYLWATVDIEDTDDVVDLVIDRLLEIQVEDSLPVYVVPVRPLDRVLVMPRATAGTRARPYSFT